MIYRALDHATDREVAIKLLPADPDIDPRRIAREAKAMASIDAPGVPQLIDRGVTAFGQAYFVLEWLEGESLADRLASRPMTMGEAVRTALAVGRSLIAVHAAGIVHRDLKPGNIVLCPPPRGPTLLDFGVAAISEATRITTDGVGLGTPGYMAPEQGRGATPDPRMDIYALGCVLFECLAGALPPAELPGCSPALDALLERCLADTPAMRPPTSRLMVAALEAVPEARQ